jgi:CheY-like chemotaxis protein
MEPPEVVTTLQRAGGFMNRILVIDDDQAIQKALKRLFEAEGYEVEVSGDGKSALETVRAVAPTSAPFTVLAIGLYAE